jgi:hypothetical protein
MVAKSLLNTYAALFVIAASGEATAMSVGERTDACEAVASGATAETSDEAYPEGQCLGMAAAIGNVLVDNFELGRGNLPGLVPMIGPPPTYGDVVRSFLKWSENNKDLHGERAVDGFIGAVVSGYTCRS